MALKKMEKVNIFDQIAKNKRNSIFLSIFVFIILSSLVYIIVFVFIPELAFIIVIFAFVVIIVHIYYSYNYGDRIVLKATKAEPADERKHRYLIDTVEGLAIAAGIPKPKVYVIESDEMNAFATGKDPQHASIAVTTGLLENLKRDELEGVIGHEMSHIRNFDIRFAMIVAVMVGLAAIISHMFLRSLRYGGIRGSRNDKGKGFVIMLIIAAILAIFAPIATRLVQAAISRRREYLADAGGAELTRYPEGLASALEKIKNYNKGKMNVSEAMSHIFFIDPNKNPLDQLFATHPPIDKRIKTLRSM